MAENNKARKSKIQRKTAETDISLELDLDGNGVYKIESGVPFLDHMLTLFTVHGFFDLTLHATGDTAVDDHHTVEDIGICLGKAIGDALGEKGGIARYGSCYLPMDETLVRVVVDISNRPYLHYEAGVVEQKLGTFDTALAKEFFRAVVQHAGLTLHIDLLHGENGHHIIEAVFKGFGRTLRGACQKIDIEGALSSKGSL
ncbi:imidazoleglycerol-phosphate dehydratase HisB [Desulforhopalus sp. IMCC35007]|uniref:imidazoleglycerol-phosphate dehydratase HisB n=1 Tax=Desulforhopalus sp. IMCC35007 TaxID=2569543 RepID=UPI0010AEDCBF|nr:imidazoleglycerol-phosphate dehydratase HisB [Desulforhopalus sp. IMCC35007]TKB08029.1 imidazoleglycerol-phosphate dehydratase HisB [Desulforhopalus sp. IMCC35007]